MFMHKLGEKYEFYHIAITLSNRIYLKYKDFLHIVNLGGIFVRKNNFWGIIFLLIGISFIAKRIIYINVFHFIVPLAFIYWGVNRIPRRRERNFRLESGKSNVIFNSAEIVASPHQNKYDVIFSNAVIDLTTLPVPLDYRHIKIDTVFSRSLIKINPDVPAIIKVSSVFSSAHMPNGSMISFGDYTYATRSYREGLPHLYIKADVVFGHTDIIEGNGFF